MTESSPPSPQPEARGATPRRRKGPFRSGLLTLLVAVAILVFLCGEFFCDGLIAWALSTTVTSTTGARVEIRQSDISLLTASVSLRDMDLFPYFATDEALFHGQRATASLDVGAAFQGRVWIPELSLVGGVITLRRDANGKLNIDPGPPPAGEAPEADAPPAKPLPEEADPVQQVADLIDRLQRYQGYYAKLRELRRKQAADEKGSERVYPGTASYLPARHEKEQPRLWIKQIEARDLRLVSHDARTGQPFLPIDALSIRVENLTEDTSLTGRPIRWEIEAATPRVGNWRLRYASPDPRSEALASRLSFSLADVPVDAVTSLVTRSLPFTLRGGTMTLETVARKAALAGKEGAASGPMKIVDGKVRGAVRLRLETLELSVADGSAKILGLPGPTFAELFNHAVGEKPLVLLFSVDGRLGRPRISLLNGREILETLKQRALGAAEEKIRALAQEVTTEVEAEVTRQLDAARALTGDSLDAATGEIDKQLGGALEKTPLGDKLMPGKDRLEGKSGKAIDKAAGKVDEILDRGMGSLGGLLGGGKDEDDADRSKDQDPKHDKKKGGKGQKKNAKKNKKKKKKNGSGSD